MNSELKHLLSRIGNTVPFLDIDLIDVNQRGNFDSTPLDVAIVWGDVSAVKLLLASGADVNARLEYAETPLHEAARFGIEEIVRLLLEQGAFIDATNESGQTPLDIAKIKGNPNIIALLAGARSQKSDDR
jgi:ankyrin repeat protein